MSSLGSHIGDSKGEFCRQLPLEAQTPLLHIAFRMIPSIHLRDRLHHLSQKLLCPLSSESSARRWRDAIRKWKSNGVVGMNSINGAGISRTRGIYHVVVWIQGEGDVVWYPEDPVATANDGLRCPAICNSQPRRQVVPGQRKIITCAWCNQKGVAHHGWHSCRKKLIDVTSCAGVKVGKPIKTFRPRPL